MNAPATRSFRVIGMDCAEEIAALRREVGPLVHRGTGVLVADGVSWLQDAPGPRTINALTSQRLTDRAHGSTFYDIKVDIRAE